MRLDEINWDDMRGDRIRIDQVRLDEMRWNEMRRDEMRWERLNDIILQNVELNGTKSQQSIKEEIVLKSTNEKINK